jgi:RND family efflux transporter MFP subunit
MKSQLWLLPAAATIGLGIAMFAVLRGQLGDGPERTRADVAHTAVPDLAPAPFPSQVAGTGVVEAGTGNIAIGTPVSGIVAAVPVRWGDHVEAGATLFRLDDRDLQAQLPVAIAKVREADARLERARYQSQLADRLRDQHVLSEEQYRDRRFEVQIDDAAVRTARAEVDQIRREIERRTIRAPVAGRILQINTRPGEFAESGVLATPLMVVGDDVRLRVRVDIDENDAGRVSPSARAVAIVRGRPDLRTELHFESIEPYVAPRRSLSGDATERVDTRVLQVIYSFDRANLPVYVGQHVDVFIQAPAAGTAR